MSTIRVIQNKQRLTKEGNAPLYITFYIGKEKLMLPCKVSVSAAKFDEKSGLLKGSSNEAKDVNLIINNMRARTYSGAYPFSIPEVHPAPKRGKLAPF